MAAAIAIPPVSDRTRDATNFFESQGVPCSIQPIRAVAMPPKKAAKAKKHVLIEKPIALDSFEAKRVIQICKENNVKLGVVVQNRFNPELQAIKSRMDDFGKIHVASAVCRWHRPDEYYHGEWMESQARSGGVAIHQVRRLRGDLNSDGVVSIADLNLVLIHWGKTGGAIDDPQADG